MARRKSDSPQKAAMREMMSVLLEGALDEELNEELGIPNMITATNCEQSGVIGERPGGDIA